MQLRASSSTKPFIIGLIGALLYVAPFWILNIESHPSLHDSWDANWAWWEFLRYHDAWAMPSDQLIPGIMNGVPRISLGSEWFLPAVMVRIAGLINGWLITKTIIYLTAYIGCWSCLTHMPNNWKKVLPKSYWPWVSLMFTWLPFYTVFGISIAGLPLVLSSFIQLWHPPKSLINKVLPLAILCVYGLYSSFVLTGIFIALIWAAILCVRVITQILEKKSLTSTGYFFLGGLVLLISFIASDYRLISHIIQPAFTAHRLTMNVSTQSVAQVISKRFLPNLLFGQYHVPSNQWPSLWIWVAIMTVMSSLSYIMNARNSHRKETITPKVVRYFWFTLALCILISFIYSLRYWQGISILQNISPLIMQFNWGRFHFFHPLLWWGLSVLGLIYIRLIAQTIFSNRKWTTQFLCTVYVVSLLLPLIYQHTEITALVTPQKQPSLHTFLAPELFEAARNKMDDPDKAKIINIGLHPSASQIAHFSTLDHYLVLYPLEYKQQWQTLMTKTWASAPNIQEYFNHSGNRCYAYTPELGTGITHLLTSPPKVSIPAPNFDKMTLKQLQATHLFSIAPLIPPSKKAEWDIKLNEAHKNENIPWTLYVYEIMWKKSNR